MDFSPGRLFCIHPLTAQPILFRRTANLFFEKAKEMLRILKAQHICHLLRIHLRREDSFFHNLRYLQLNMFVRRLSGFRFHQIAEVVGRKANLIGKILHGRQSLKRSHAGIPILVQQLFQTGQAHCYSTLRA